MLVFIYSLNRSPTASIKITKASNFLFSLVILHMLLIKSLSGKLPSENG